MEPLPSSIEAYLEEAGFSGTEIIVLKKLLEEDALTLRELASKTGKSTGVLDQAVKKLLSKKILTRESINDTPKYVLKSLDSVLAWLEEDVRTRQQMIVRKHQNFEMYVRTLSNGKRRPDMEHFEGAENIKKAYNKLLERGNDIIQYGPTLYLVDEDPLRDFRIQYFRDRRTRGLFSRVITHNTPLGRRFQSRDAFEYRKTILVDKEDYPFTFEKIIVGDTVACFQLEENIACFIKYPELAQEERLFFERLWNKNIESQRVSEETIEQVEVFEKKTCVPLTIKTASRLRDFFLSPKSLIAFGTCAVLAAGVTWGLYKNNEFVNFKRMQDRVIAIATTGAIQINYRDLDQLRTQQDYQKPEWLKVGKTLEDIRTGNSDIIYSYIFRKSSSDSSKLEFVADGLSINPFANTDDDPTNDVDMNRDGMIDGSPTGGDYLAWPGQLYPNPPAAAFESFNGLSASEVYEDQWGRVVTGFAPLKDERGITVAVLAIDMQAAMLDELTSNTFSFVYVFALLFLLFVIIRLAVFDRSIFLEMYQACQRKKVVLIIVGTGIASVLLSVGMYSASTRNNIELAQEKIRSIATTGAFQFEAGDLDQLQTLQDSRSDIHQKVVQVLHQIRSGNTDIQYAYLFRPNARTSTFEFIADADAYGFDLTVPNDLNKNGVIDEADEVGYPGLSYDISYIPELQNGEYKAPVATNTPYTDKWGTSLSGYAPITRQDGSIAGILGVDVDASEIYAVRFSTMFPVALYIAAVIAYVIFGMPGFKKTPLSKILKVVLSRKVLVIVSFSLMATYWLTFALYFYTIHVMKEEIGKRLMAIAVTAASQINPDDLEPLRFARDMKREEYQRVFAQLNDIRDKNREITFVYVLRPTYRKGIWEFIVDADSNYDIPLINKDFDNDGQLDDADESVWPGVGYDIEFAAPILFKNGLNAPTFEQGLQDQWGSSISASAPIFKNGESVAVLAIDMYVNDLFSERKIKSLKSILITISGFILMIFVYVNLFKKAVNL